LDDDEKYLSITKLLDSMTTEERERSRPQLRFPLDSDILIFRTLDAWDSSKFGLKDRLNFFGYDLLVRDTYPDLQRAAAMNNLSCRIVAGEYATLERLKLELRNNPKLSRLIIIAHANRAGMLLDAKSKQITFLRYEIANKNISIIDIVACYIDAAAATTASIAPWKDVAPNAEVRAYNVPMKEIYFYQTNHIIN
jgi:hypothetical protein